jgi:hypothetical protein
METEKKCIEIKKDGSQCEAPALKDSQLCYFHEPFKAAERKAAQSLGGQGNRLRTLNPDIPDIKIESSKDVIALLCETINKVRKGQIDSRDANTVGYLANIAMTGLERNDVEMRIRRLEELLGNRLARYRRRGSRD